MFRRYILGLLLVFCFAFGHAAEKRNVSVASNGGAEKRVALVIGNGTYANSPLKNPPNDARDMAVALRGLGFTVIEKTNATQKEMNRAIAQFGEKLTADTVALFFYAGHGMQVKGKNYLLPIDAQIAAEASIRAEAVDVDAVLDQFATSPMSIVILDACRNNPFERKFRSVGGGLAQMDAPKGTLIAYATSPGKTAADGSGNNGLYTAELLKALKEPGLKVEEVFKRVRANVARSTGDTQIPWEASSLVGDFYFRQVTQIASVKPSQPPSGFVPIDGVLEVKPSPQVPSPPIPSKNRPQKEDVSPGKPSLPKPLSKAVERGWKRVLSDAKGTMYADPSTIRRTGDKGTLWWLMDYREARSYKDGTKYLSAKFQDEIDCQSDRSRLTASISTASNMGGGAVVFSDFTPGDWEPVIPGSVMEHFLKAVCRNEPIQVEAVSYDELAKTRKDEEDLNKKTVDFGNCVDLDQKRLKAIIAKDWPKAVSTSKGYLDGCKDAEHLRMAMGSVWLEVVGAYTELGDLDNALASADHCIKTFPSRLLCHKAKIMTLYRLGRRSDIKASIDIVEPIARQLIDKNRLALLGEKNPKKRNELRGEIDRDEHFVESIYSEAKDFENAIEAGNKCIKAHDSNLKCHGLKISALLKLGRTQEGFDAIDTVEKVVSDLITSKKRDLHSKKGKKEINELAASINELESFLEEAREVRRTGHAPDG